MPAKLELIRTPRSQKRMTPLIAKEIELSHAHLGRTIVKEAEKDVRDWSDKPNFRVVVKSSRRRHSLTIKYDARTLGGRKYKWVDQGTASYRKKGGGRKPYKIRPRKANGVIRYNLPSPMPKTSAADGSLAPSYTANEATIIAKEVTHPGIKPREFMASYIKDSVQSRKPGSFYNVTEAAIRRGQRKGKR